MKKSSVLKKLNRTYPNIMADIGDVLTQNSIQYKKTQSEIVAFESSKKAINMVISSLIPDSDKKILLDVVGTRDKVYIRRRCS